MGLPHTKAERRPSPLFPGFKPFRASFEGDAALFANESAARHAFRTRRRELVDRRAIARVGSEIWFDPEEAADVFKRAATMRTWREPKVAPPSDVASLDRNKEPEPVRMRAIAYGYWGGKPVEVGDIVWCDKDIASDMCRTGRWELFERDTDKRARPTKAQSALATKRLHEAARLYCLAAGIHQHSLELRAEFEEIGALLVKVGVSRGARMGGWLQKSVDLTHEALARAEAELLAAVAALQARRTPNAPWTLALPDCVLTLDPGYDTLPHGQRIEYRRLSELAGAAS